MYNPPNIIFVGEFLFPEGCAAAVRVLGLGKALRDAGKKVLFAGMEKQPRPEDIQPDGTCIYQGFPYLPGEYLGKGSLYRWGWLWRAHISGNTTFQRLKTLDLSAVEAIIAYHPPIIFLKKLMLFCRRQKIALITDTTEWFHPRHLPGRWISPFYWEQEYRLRCLQPKVGNMIAISSYLESYFQSRKCLTVCIPTLLDFANAESLSQDMDTRTDYDELRLVFTGSHLREKWSVIFEALLRLRQAGKRIRLDIYGNSRETFYHILEPANRLLADELGEALTIHGRPPREEYLRGVANSDFLIMLRDIEPWSQACFPTKFPELMLQGVPIISNAHSDLGKYVRDGEDGLLVSRPSADDLVRTLERALQLPRTEIMRMKNQSRQRVAECFDYKLYIQSLRDFIEKAVNKVNR